ncbi:MAG: choice-of-anchor D domain-containing protein [Myxococcales bacterium]|nr:MAG: choice-of-anchor D domain-containing protein [Myxococcales bacterium]
MSTFRQAVWIAITVLMAIGSIACDDEGQAGSQPSADTDDGGIIRTCVGPEDCPKGFYCVDNQCVNPNDGDIDIDAVITCHEDEDCPLGYFCGDDNICYPTEGFACKDGECPIGFECREGVCRQVDEVYPCTTSDDCPAGAICRDGYCWAVDLDGDHGDGDIPDVYGPQINIPDEISFGSAILNTPTVRELRIISSGTESLMVYSIILDGSSDPDYKLLNAPQQATELAPGDKLPISIQLLPTKPGRQFGKVIVTSNDAETNTVEVRLSSDYKGEANIVIEPSEIDFGPTSLTAPPAEGEIKIANMPLDEDSNRVLEIRSIHLAAEADPNFEVALEADQFPVLVGPGEANAFVFQVLYHPMTLEAHTETVVIVEALPGAETREHLVQLLGEGVIPLLEMTPVGDIHFGLASIGRTESRRIMLSNVGRAPLSILDIRLGAPQDATFGLDAATAIGAALEAGQSVEFAVTYTPAAEENNATTLVVETNSYEDPNRAVRVDGRGILSDLRAVPPFLDFGDVRVGAFKDLDVVLYNDGDDQVEILAIDFGAGMEEYGLADPGRLPLTLQPDQASSVAFRFSPTDEVADSGEALVRVNTGEGDLPLPVTGRGVLPHLTWEPPGDAFDFGQVVVGDTESRTLLLRNTGFYPLQITAIRLDSAPLSNFLALPTDDVAIQPGATHALTLRYTPALSTPPGLETQHLTFHTDDDDYPDPVFTLTGDPVDPQLARVPPENPVDFGSVDVGEEKTEVFILTNSGAGTLVIDQIALTPASEANGYRIDLGDVQFPLLLDPRARAQFEFAFTVVFSPPDYDPDLDGQITIRSNDRRYLNGYIVNLVASGSGCESGLHRCNGVCVREDSIETCGERCEPCPQPSFSETQCAYSEATQTYDCDFTCDPGYIEYEDECRQQGQPDCCGPDCIVCPPPPENAEVACLNDECVFLCDAGMHICLDDPLLGEYACYFDDDIDNCGPDCISCPVPESGAAYCVGGQCLTVCDQGNHVCPDGNCYSVNDITHCGPQCVTCQAPVGGSVLCLGDQCKPQCPQGQHVCNGVCYPDADILHCGAACLACPVPQNGEALCVGGQCRPNCNESYHRCGNDCYPANDPGHCGVNCEVCPVPANGEALCVGNVCRSVCDDNFHLCSDGNCYADDSVTACGDACVTCAVPANGYALCVGGECETYCNPAHHFCSDGNCFRDTDSTHCGNACTQCSQPVNGTAYCISGVCVPECNPGFHRCADGQCYADSDSTRCGPACISCGTLDNGSVNCLNGACTSICNQGFHMCADGRCYRNNDPSHCGGNCNVCPVPQGGFAECAQDESGGSFYCKRSCYDGMHICADQKCYNNDDVTHCGPDCQTCLRPIGGIAACLNGACAKMCDEGYHLCNIAGQGETCVPNSDVDHCGPLCAACPTLPNSTPYCVGGSCALLCDAENGFHPCRDTQGNITSCEADTDIKHCGAACLTCPVPLGGAAACINGQCDAACPADTHICGAPGQADYACRTDNDFRYCGDACVECTVPAGGSAFCVGGTCEPRCPADRHLCGAAPNQSCERNNDPAKCGPNCLTCEVPAGGFAQCVNGACQPTCPANMRLCGGPGSYLCVALDDPTHCGPTCQPCTAPTGGTAACVNNVCDVQCPSGYHLCGDTCYPNNDADHCGAACSDCPEPQGAGHAECLNGACARVCNDGNHLCADGNCYANGDADHCGAACTDCAAPLGAGQAVCVNGQCDKQCIAGFHYCSGDNTCHANDDADHCGAACTDCPAPLGAGQAVCLNGQCDKQCLAGFHYCSGDDTCYGNADADHCGPSCTDCPVPIGGIAECSNNACVKKCFAGYHYCAATNTCYPDTDKDHCGANCEDCAEPQGAGSAVCLNNACQISCNAGNHACSVGGQWYCYANSDAAHCGDDCQPCAAPVDGMAQCVNGACQYSCLPNWHLCKVGPGAQDWQCFSNADPTHCGDETNECVACTAPAGGTAQCLNGACTSSCPGSTHVCGAPPDQTCRANDDPDYCGASCTDCPEPAGCPSCDPIGTVGYAECINNACQKTCFSGYHLCPAGSTCYSNADPDHCGASCADCAAPLNGDDTCLNGVCGKSCPTGAHLCSPGFDECFLDSDGEHCGSTCVECNYPLGCTTCEVQGTDGYADCLNNACVPRCTPGNHLCPGDQTTCFANADADHCGSNCNTCVDPDHGRATCINGGCDWTCDPYYRKNNGITQCTEANKSLCCLPNNEVTCCGLTCQNCTVPPDLHTVGICQNTGNPANPYQCGLACATDYRDYNDNLVDGCECLYGGTEDLPDDNGWDRNCDGADGLVGETVAQSNAVYVSKDGNPFPAGTGTYANPVNTIEDGIDVAVSAGKAYVLMTGERYQENVELVAGVNLFGGYSATFRTRDTSLNRTTIEGQNPDYSDTFGAVTGFNITTATEVSGFEIVGVEADNWAESTYALYLKDCNNALVIKNNTISGGQAGFGQRGQNGLSGTDGVAGITGLNAKFAGGSTRQCSGTNAGGGAGQLTCQIAGQSQVNVSGGAGGGGYCGSGNSPADPMTSGTVGNNGGGGGGAGGYLSVESPSGCSPCNVPDNNDPPQDSAGNMGVNAALPAQDGAGGAGCTNIGSLVNGLWVVGAAQQGQNGTHGRGGGGGGSGGGVNATNNCNLADQFGGSGGGGGSGGCAGTFGNPAQSGGLSFAVLIIFTNAPGSANAQPDLRNNVILLGRGGDGGDGGSGGAGGAGGPGGPNGLGGIQSLFCAPNGGSGGSGSRGGHGGGGGGGCGGNVYGVYVHNYGSATPNYQTRNNTFLTIRARIGQGGAGGFGGFSLNPGQPGANGVLDEYNW